MGFHSHSHTTKQSTERELEHICMPYTCDSYRHFNVKYFILTAPNINTFMPRERERKKKHLNQNTPSQKYVYKTLELCVWRSHLLPFIVCRYINPHEKNIPNENVSYSQNDWLRQSGMYGNIEKSLDTSSVLPNQINCFEK